MLVDTVELVKFGRQLKMVKSKMVWGGIDSLEAKESHYVFVTFQVAFLFVPRAIFISSEDYYRRELETRDFYK